MVTKIGKWGIVGDQKKVGRIWEIKVLDIDGAVALQVVPEHGGGYV